jgi:hypothetical protein
MKVHDLPVATDALQDEGAPLARRFAAQLKGNDGVSIELLNQEVLRRKGCRSDVGRRHYQDHGRYAGGRDRTNNAQLTIDGVQPLIEAIRKIPGPVETQLRVLTDPAVALYNRLATRY